MQKVAKKMVNGSVALVSSKLQKEDVLTRDLKKDDGTVSAFEWREDEIKRQKASAPQTELA